MGVGAWTSSRWWLDPCLMVSSRKIAGLAILAPSFLPSRVIPRPLSPLGTSFPFSSLPPSLACSQQYIVSGLSSESWRCCSAFKACHCRLPGYTTPLCLRPLTSVYKDDPYQLSQSSWFRLRQTRVEVLQDPGTSLRFVLPRTLDTRITRCLRGRVLESRMQPDAGHGRAMSSVC